MNDLRSLNPYSCSDLTNGSGYNKRTCANVKFSKKEGVLKRRNVDGKVQHGDGNKDEQPVCVRVRTQRGGRRGLLRKVWKHGKVNEKGTGRYGERI